jgi:succinyl-CoA synthetase beta subunit
MLLDRATGDHLAMMTAEGGMDIEELARTRPEALRRVRVDAMLGLRAFHVRELVGTLPHDAREGAADVLRRMYELLIERDATLVEVNPLVQLEDGSVVALDAKVTVDDNALFRHPEVEAYSAAFPIDPVQARANEEGLQYVKLDGNVGIIGNGAGLVMSTLDVVAQAGAHAANFLDVGGGASADQMATSLEVVLSDPAVKAVFINIFGGITRCDLVAEGVLGALERVDAQVPLVVRLDGTNAEEGRRILAEAAHPRVVAAATMLEAAERAAALANGAAA